MYIGFIIHIDRGPVDYETFVNIGGHFLSGAEVYGENSYYPMPYVLVFAFFSWLPRWLSMLLWMLLPVLAALFISGWDPFILLFAPLFGHFVGGQSVVFSLLGLWGYRNSQHEHQKMRGGIWLAVMAMKPQLAIFPISWACIQWIKYFLEEKKISRQFWGFVLTMLLIHLPCFLIFPDWVSCWLANPRPLFIRALSGLVPRSLALLFSGGSPFFWLILFGLAVFIFFIVLKINHNHLNLDLLVLYSFVVSPLVHDYDLIQLIPLIDTSRLRKFAALISLPGWIVIFFQYTNDSAWFLFTLIPPALLVFRLITDLSATEPVKRPVAIHK